MTQHDTTTTHGVPVISRPGERELVRYYGTELAVALRSVQTGGQFYLHVAELTAADAPPLHVHTREDEIWVVESGTFRFWIGGTSLDTAGTHDVGPGSIVYGPRGVAHTFQVLDPVGRVAVLVSPPRSEDYFLGVGPAEGREDFDHLDRLEDFGIHVLDRAPVDGA
ncbi:cupin domain-containing protein [Pseudonocardia sp. ICBG1293]|uniref:cupin domain-containing protein n=1 Tax=Pseudonocardia sp. ICBG1293 TaxID=2844382 RepID=UPI001CC9D8E9|nr:cupin domain-containing protein [Pseudonocardia sp. ICBG1293]